MNFSKLAGIEKKLRTTQFSGHYQLEDFSFQVPGENLFLNGLTCRPSSGYTSYYYAAEYPKEQIVLHHTAGYLKSDIHALSQKNWHVSVAYVISREGTVYQMHNPLHWSYHLGRGAVGGNATGSKKSIGIELCNYGYLVRHDNDLETIYSRVYNKVTGRNNPVDVYCTLNDTELYLKLEEPFRGESYFATFTNEQYESLILLLRYLTVKYNIPKAFLEEEERYVTTESVVDFKGILSHINFRQSDKWDLGPAFDWGRVIKGVQSEQYAVKSTAEVSLQKAELALEKAQKDFNLAQRKLTEAEARLAMAKENAASERDHSGPGDLGRDSSAPGVFKEEKDIDLVYPKGQDGGEDPAAYGQYGPERDYDPFNYSE